MTDRDFMKTPIGFKLWMAFIVCAMVIGSYFMYNHYQQNMADCMADGHKRYQCEAMFTARSTVITTVDTNTGM